MLEMRSCLYNSQKHWHVSHYTVHFVLLLGDDCISCITIIITYLTLNRIAQAIFTLINELTGQTTVRLKHLNIWTKATTYRVTILYHKVITDVLTVLQCNIKCSGNVVLHIDSGCSDVVQEDKISLEIADARW